MRKICEIDAVKIHADTGQMPWVNNPRFSKGRHRHRVRPEWIQAAFSLPQQMFLERCRYTLRPHPRHSPAVEVFVDEANLTDADWTLIRIMF